MAPSTAPSSPPFTDPFRHDRNDSFSSSTTRSSVSIDQSAFAGHRDTLARIPPVQRVAAMFPQDVIEQLLRYLPLEDYLNLRLVCRRWCKALPQPRFSGFGKLPQEVLHLIFSFLEPPDFDAARHTCRAWFFAGLNSGTLRSMLRAAQCQHAFKADIRRLSPVGEPMDDEWLMSKRLATASRLTPEWKGENRFHLAETVDFRRILMPQMCSPRYITQLFTVSACGQYVLVRSGHDVFVYKLEGVSDTLDAVVRLAADKMVLKVSMDTSSGRYAVAALLENRIGILWDLSDDSNTEMHSGEPMTLSMQTELHGSMPGPEVMSGALPVRRENADSWAPELHGSPSDLEKGFSSHSHLFGIPLSLCETPEEEVHKELQPGIAIQTRASAVYGNLGARDDLPRSVAICPQRKCVAFGCRTGIELHWVDSLTGGGLNRWFPLVAPSDFLYFLPQRLGLDSTKKLRLISSAAPAVLSIAHYRAGSMPAPIMRARTHDRARRQSMTRFFFGNLPFPSAFPSMWSALDVDDLNDDRHGVLRAVDCDHYQAIPLSDGLHMLYIDPASGLLCLGSDAPIHAPTKLARKVIFVPPTVNDEENDMGYMSCFNAGQDLDWGVTVVSANTDGRVILYIVPSDVFEYISALRSNTAGIWDENAGVLAQSDLLMDDVLGSRPHANTFSDPFSGNDAAQPSSSSQSTALRTVQIQGVEIVHMGRDVVDDVAVNTTNGGLSVWIFARSGLAKQYSIFTDRQEMRKRYVHGNGLLYEEARSPSGKGKQPEVRG